MATLDLLVHLESLEHVVEPVHQDSLVLLDTQVLLVHEGQMENLDLLVPLDH